MSDERLILIERENRPCFWITQFFLSTDAKIE